MKQRPAMLAIGPVLLLAPALSAQGGGFLPQPNIISTSADGARSVFAADLDGDLDVDVLSASVIDDKIAWYENDGTGSFGPEQIISTSANVASAVFAADLDGDLDLDVISASGSDDKVAWYENTDGLGTFGPEQIITQLADVAGSVFAADLDGDFDQDVLSASRNDDKIAWYRNDGTGSFGSQLLITNLADGAESVFAIDLDGDDDRDVLSASANDDTIAWYENDGVGNFGTAQLISTSANGAQAVFAASLNGDLAPDVLSASRNDDKIAWYENDGTGNFGPEQIITSAADGAESVFAADLDGDGDLDVIAASANDDTIAWFENTDGLGTFGPEQVIFDNAAGAISVIAADLDGDLDFDVISASANDDTIAWFENIPGAQAIPYGCGVNPPGSFTVISGAPSLGTTMTFGVNNPAGTQAVGSLPFIALSLQPDPAFPCGTVVTQFGMVENGELLIAAIPPPFAIVGGPAWDGVSPAPVDLPVPFDTSLLGGTIYVQGLMLDVMPGASVIFGLADAFQLIVGP